jgi:hypothetical protein
MKPPAPLHIASIASQAVTVTNVSSWKSVGVFSEEEVVMGDFEEVSVEEGKIIRLATVGQRSFMRGRKLFSFCERAGRMSIRIERRDRRR